MRLYLCINHYSENKIKLTDSKGIRVLIAGLAKSGTTILTYRVASCYDKPKVFFEPGKAKSLHDISIHREIINLPREIVITKSLFSPQHPSSANQIGDLYDKKIWIYRDPRDWIISRFFYQWRKFYCNFFVVIIEYFKSSKK